MLKFSKERLQDFLSVAATGNIMYHRERQYYLVLFNKARWQLRDRTTPVTIPMVLTNSIVSALITKSREINDDKSLAFYTGVAELMELLDTGPVPAPIEHRTEDEDTSEHDEEADDLESGRLKGKWIPPRTYKKRNRIQRDNNNEVPVKIKQPEVPEEYVPPFSEIGEFGST